MFLSLSRIILLCLFSLSLRAGYPYQLNTETELKILSYTGITSYYLIHSQRDDFSTLAQVNNLDPNDLPSIDRPYANFNAKDGASELSDNFQYFGILTAYLSSFTDGHNWWRTAIMYLEADYLSSTSASFLQRHTTFYAPYAYDPSAPDALRTDYTAKMTFLSMHVARTSTAFFFMAKVYSDTNPDNFWGRTFAYSLATLGSLVGAAARVEARLHFPSDSLAAVLWGGYIGWYIPEIHRIGDFMVLNPVVGNDYAGLSLNFRF